MDDQLRLLAIRFLKHVRTGSGCWEWVGARSQGYGAFASEHGLPERAHRVSYRLFVADIPAGAVICHHCDNRSCVRPDHLFPGTQLDNMRDAQQKGRMARGARNGWTTSPGRMPRGRARTRITDDQVREVRRRLANGEMGSHIARSLNINYATVSRIKNGSRRAAA